MYSHPSDIYSKYGCIYSYDLHHHVHIASKCNLILSIIINYAVHIAVGDNPVTSIHNSGIRSIDDFISLYELSTGLTKDTTFYYGHYEF